MQRDIVVFERDEHNTKSGKPELDFRLIRQALPGGSCPLCIADHSGFGAHTGQWFLDDEVITFAEKQSGYKSGWTLNQHKEE